MASEGYHEPVDKLRPETLDRHRAIISLMEELEAVDWYDQRVDATSDPELAAILAHNRDEEKEHAAMTLEWLRRQDPALDEQLRTYLFAEGDILDAEATAMGREDPAMGREDPAMGREDPAMGREDAATGSDGAAEPDTTPTRPADGSLGIGSLRGDTLR